MLIYEPSRFILEQVCDVEAEVASRDRALNLGDAESH
jgi:hypothetical protein